MTPKRLVFRLRTAASLLLLPLSVSACGFIFSHAPPDGHERMEYFSCTEGNAGPIIDIIWGSLNVLGALVVASDPDAYDTPGATIASGLVWGVLSGSAAGVGFNKSRKCRAARQQLAERQAQGRGPLRQPQADVPAGAPTVEAVVVSPHLDTLAVGERVQLVATAHNSSGGAIPNRAFSWSSSNDAIASVGSAGLVTAHATGSVVIAARTENVVGTSTLVVVSRR
jgi:hypothetical protein